MNVRQILGAKPKPEKKIRDMSPGETGYTVPWAYSEEYGGLNEDFRIGKKGGTASLYVECVALGEYVIEFEQPKYRNPFTGEWSDAN